MKGSPSTHYYSEQGKKNHDEIKWESPPGPKQKWRNIYYPDKTMELPIGIPAGDNWVKVL